MTNADWVVLDKLVSLLELFHNGTKKLSHRYANSSLIIPEIMILKSTLSSQQTKVTLTGLGKTVNTLLEQMKTRYEPYLENQNLLLATYLDPRWKNPPFKKDPDTAIMSTSLSSVEDLVIQRFLIHEKEQQVYEEQKRKEEEAKKREEEENKYRMHKPPAASSTSNDIGIVGVSESQCDNTVNAVKPISLTSIFANSAAKLFGEEDEQIEVTEELMSQDERVKRMMIEHEIKSYKEIKRISMDEDPLKWWMMHAINFPHLRTVAARYLSSPPSSVESEWVFSIGGNIVTKDRSRLTADNTKKLIFLNSNLPLLPIQDYSEYF